jgi:hypothetical protein
MEKYPEADDRDHLQVFGAMTHFDLGAKSSVFDKSALRPENAYR